MPDLSDFAGDWIFERRIEDRANGVDGRMTGHARLGWEGEILVHEESGRLRMGDNAPLDAVQRHLWVAGEGEVRVRFRDGRPFHAFDPAARYARGRHLCGADLYDVVYDFSRWPLWTITWIVSGPRKDYTTCSAYVGR